MNYRKLGKSNLQISEIGFGCMSLEENSNKNELILEKAVDAGINFFDTADLYDKGSNEQLLGKAIKSVRKNVILASKVGNQCKKDGTGWDWNPRKSYILQAVEESLIRLQTDYIDLYQLHGGTIDDPIDEVIEVFELLVEQGKIRYYGISSIRPNVIREYAAKSNISSVMMQYSLMDRRPEESCLELLENKQIGVLSRGGLAKGLLVSKSSKAYLNYSEEEVETIQSLIREIDGLGTTSSKVALGFILNKKAISSAVVGIRTMNQLEEILNASNGQKLRSEELKILYDTIAPNYYENHR
ncbi:MAG: aryl-alcohol dehydrogenase-like predicted oxidoreductase [Cyclobacteriaceae bacterium]|jgi:aryl-alcohol dehydrogenase-like predicted oxidoreductase